MLLNILLQDSQVHSKVQTFQVCLVQEIEHFPWIRKGRRKKKSLKEQKYP